jgi:Tol biopolymer transport system component
MTILTLVVMAVLAAAPQNQDKAEVALKAAMDKEVLDGNLKAAIEQYRKIAATYRGNRSVAARALLQLGRCYEKQGDAEARKAYDQLVREYGDQKEPVAAARVRLAALERAGGLRYPPGITLRKAWVGAIGVVEGSPSLDGRHLSFVDWETGDLAVRDLVTGQNRRLTNKGTWKDSDEYADASAISGDGRQVAFAWFNKEKHYELRVMGMDGSQPRVVFSDKEVSYLEPYQWTADGKHILAYLNLKAEERRFALIPAGGGPVRVLKTLAGLIEYASLSPDGRFLVYGAPAQGDGKERDIFLLSVEGGQEIPLVRHPADDFNAIWMPDGKRVLFVSDRTGTNGFWVIDVVDGKPQGLPQLLKDGVGRRIRLNGFTRQGSLYYSLSTRTQDVHIAEVDSAAGKVLRQPAPVAARFVGSNSAPSWSPDGRRLAYYSQRSDSRWVGGPTLVIHSVETGEERDVPTRLVQEVLAPVRWFPDGKSVLVSAYESPKRDQVAFYRVDAQTGDHRLVRSSPGPGPAGAALSPDGKTLFFFTGGEQKLWGGVISRDIETGEEREITRVPFMGPDSGWTETAVSPDGRYLAFRRPVDESWTALMLVPAMGGELRELYRYRLQSEPEIYGELSWTRDGRNVLFVRSTGKNDMPELWRIPIAGGEPQRTGLSMEGMRIVAAHPDGRRIAFDSGKGTGAPGEVWVLENLPAAAESKAVAGAK